MATSTMEKFDADMLTLLDAAKSMAAIKKLREAARKLRSRYDASFADKI